MATGSEPADDTSPWWRLASGRLAPDERIELPMLSGSMAPVLPVGATLLIGGLPPAGGSKCRTGDVAVFRDGDRLVAHRLLLEVPPIRPLVFLQAGDGISRAGWVRATALAGLVVAVRTQAGEPCDLRTPAARRQGRQLARRRLRRLLSEPLRRLARKGISWLTHR